MAGLTRIDYEEFYSRPYNWQYYRDGNVPFVDAKRLLKAIIPLGYDDTKRVLIVGCGLGASVHYLRRATGNTNVYGTDISDYIHSIKATDKDADFNPDTVLNINILDADTKSQFQAAIGFRVFDYVIMESVTETIPSIDRRAWYEAIDALLRRSGMAIHIAQPKRYLEDADGNEILIPPLWARRGWTWQTLNLWKAEYPTHTWLHRATMQIAP